MKRLFIAPALLIATTAIVLGGCLKDEGFDNHEYGINDPDTQPPGIGFPDAARTTASYAIENVATPQTIDAPFVNLEYGKTAPSDIHVNLVLNPTLVTNYNAANGTSYVVPAPNLYSISSLKVTIPAGGRNVTLPIVIPSAKAMDITKTYALGFTIESVDESGYTIAKNLQNVIIIIAVKNAWDGTYEVRGYAVRQGDAVLTGPVGPIERDFKTSAATAIQWLGSVPWANGGNSQLPAGYEPNITLDPVTNKVTSITSSNGAVSMDPLYDNRYDPATKTFYIQWGYTTPAIRRFTDTLRYLHPRP
ncbi:MAG TPA: DUF1735 domain-containing protein [Chitinophagaceae bacterium]